MMPEDCFALRTLTILPNIILYSFQNRIDIFKKYISIYEFLGLY